MTGDPVRWGFLGAGFVASRGMGPAVHAATGTTLFAVASRDPERSRTLEPVRVHPTYEALLDDPDVDVVYISLRNGQHREWVERALRAGKHVVCEKPLALTAADARSMFAVAAEVDRLLVEAVWAQWHPRFRRLVHLARSGALGELTAIDSRFTFTSDDLDGNYRLDPTMGGGALLDVGCYQAQAWVALTGGADALRVRQVDRVLGPTGVDLTTVAEVQLGAALRASMHCSFVEPAAQALTVSGTSASARCGDGEAFTSWREPSSLWVGGAEERFGTVDAFVVMTEAISARVRGEEAWVVPAVQSIRTAEILDLLGAATDG